MAPRTPVPAAPATPPRTSLLAAASVLDNGTDRWQAGFSWTPESCGASGASEAQCGVMPERDAPLSPPLGLSNPFLVWAADECSTFGHQVRDWQGRARRQLEATQSFQIARELWTGAITAAADPPGEQSPYLADGDVIAAADPVDVADLSVLEAWAMECGQGRRVMVHVSPRLYSAFIAAVSGPAVSITGNIASTALGNLLVTDAGYPGTPPDSVADDEMEWAYVSPMVQVRLDTVEMLPGSLGDARGMAEALRRPVNTITVWAQRFAAYQLDPCCRYAVGTDLPRIPPPPSPS